MQHGDAGVKVAQKVSLCLRCVGKRLNRKTAATARETRSTPQ